jgi:hypothetical protein
MVLKLHCSGDERDWDATPARIEAADARVPNPDLSTECHLRQSEERFE